MTNMSVFEINKKITTSKLCCKKRTEVTNTHIDKYSYSYVRA